MQKFEIAEYPFYYFSNLIIKLVLVIATFLFINSSSVIALMFDSSKKNTVEIYRNTHSGIPWKQATACGKISTLNRDPLPQVKHLSAKQHGILISQFLKFLGMPCHAMIKLQAAIIVPTVLDHLSSYMNSKKNKKI